MSGVTLSDKFLATIAGWEAMRQARAYLEMGRVLSSNWTPPILKGVVQDGSISYRAGLVIRSATDVENICTCRPAREWGTMCAHAVAVGLHHLRRTNETSAAPVGGKSFESAKAALTKSGVPSLRRVEEGGQPAELFLILPPNLDQAASRGKVMVCFEARWARGRGPLNALPKTESFTFSKEDHALLDRVEAAAGGETPAMLMLSNAEFGALLPVLADHPRITFGKSREAEVTNAPWKVPVRAVLEASGEIRLSLRQRGTPPVWLGEGWVMQGDTLRPVGLPKAYRGVWQGPVAVTRKEVPFFLSRDWSALKEGCELEATFTPEDFQLEPQSPRFLLELKGGLAQLQAVLQCAYGVRIMTPGVTSRDESFWLPDPESPLRYSTRDLAAEQAAQGRLLRAGFTGPDAQGRCHLNGQNQVLNFFARDYPRLQREWQVTLEERLERSTAQNLEWVEPRFQITPSGMQWFDLDVSFSSKAGDRFPAVEIQRLVLSGQSHTRLPGGKIALIDTGAVEELQEVLLDCAPQQHARGYRLDQRQAGFLDATLRQHEGWAVQAPPGWREKASQQSGDAKLECPPLGELETILRPYQKAGVAWLRFLRENQFGGILADEMGLGKTLQSLAFLRWVRERPEAGSGSVGGAVRLPHLIVCPTSLVFNWVAEARKFTPTLQVLPLQGPDRHRDFPRISESDLVVTSYALLRRDAERYRELEFDTVVLDEAQHIKNRQTQNAQAVKAIRGTHRLVLTGTPLENSVLDLWSIFDFLMPGYLGTAKDFRERYELPITRDKDREAQTRLSRRLRPFLLRRLKREVARDLPERLEQISFCELTEEQRAVYQKVIEASRREVLAAGEGAGLAKSRMVVLTALLRLRQICCDLRLLKLPSTAEDQAVPASGKMEMFGELLEEVIDGGHRVLVFSQFVSMLTLLREKLTEEGIEYCYLDGATTERAGVVERFQKTETIPVFLISLKAGGVGLNLTAADTVIHFDPWWNPAVEDQATDRAHRIGQTRVVTSYKLITRDTVEEKILTLQTRKREVIQGTLGGEEQLAETLTWQEIQDLLAD